MLGYRPHSLSPLSVPFAAYICGVLAHASPLAQTSDVPMDCGRRDSRRL